MCMSFYVTITSRSFLQQTHIRKPAEYTLYIYIEICIYTYVYISTPVYMHVNVYNSENNMTFGFNYRHTNIRERTTRIRNSCASHRKRNAFATNFWEARWCWVMMAVNTERTRMHSAPAIQHYLAQIPHAQQLDDRAGFIQFIIRLYWSVVSTSTIFLYDFYATHIYPNIRTRWKERRRVSASCIINIICRARVHTRVPYCKRKPNPPQRAARE